MMVLAQILSTDLHRQMTSPPLAPHSHPLLLPLGQGENRSERRGNICDYPWNRSVLEFPFLDVVGSAPAPWVATQNPPETKRQPFERAELNDSKFCVL